MLAKWQEIGAAAQSHPGVLRTEINPVVGQNAVLVHQVFADADGLVDYFSTSAAAHRAELTTFAQPQLHMARGVDIPTAAHQAMKTSGLPTAFGRWIYGYVRDDAPQPDPANAVQVTAKWTCSPGEHLAQLRYWWQRVGTDAHHMEQGLLRFEAYQVPGEDALIIHETFADSNELKFHLTKGTADKYKADIDRVAAPEAYYFRGPVAWTIRTYSKFMRLPATYGSESDRGR